LKARLVTWEGVTREFRRAEVVVFQKLERRRRGKSQIMEK